MARRHAFTRSGSLLDAPAGYDPEAWATLPITAPAKRRRPPEACQCPPPQPNRLGGCRPGLRWASHTELEACCNLCGKALISGRHRRRQQTHMLALAALGPDALDLEDCVSAGWLTRERPAAPPDPVAIASAVDRRGPAAPSATAADGPALADLLQQADQQQAWLAKATRYVRGELPGAGL